eukprot:TRINITY_DN8673_c0_g1_i1.p1 TRINITY_DN8673_c0_g1~~TRINITY_DN8673_c0_g1_i1.p1  ORF type:complete len:183 (+),score=14.04 TRINITY_DN8673_c0_g1_i1:93-641(+)
MAEAAPAAKPKRKAAAKPAGPSYIQLIVKAIGQVKGGPQGASRAAIANWIAKNSDKKAGGQFNAAIRKALKAGIAAGIIRQGATEQRYKLGEKAKSVNPKPKKKKTAKKKPAKKAAKKKTTKKKSAKKTTTKKKKTTTKKKKTAGKKKTASKKKPAKKTAGKKKTASKKKSAKKSTKKAAKK